MDALEPSCLLFPFPPSSSAPATSFRKTSWSFSNPQTGCATGWYWPQTPLIKCWSYLCQPVLIEPLIKFTKASKLFIYTRWKIWTPHLHLQGLVRFFPPSHVRHLACHAQHRHPLADHLRQQCAVHHVLESRENYILWNRTGNALVTQHHQFLKNQLFFVQLWILISVSISYIENDKSQGSDHRTSAHRWQSPLGLAKKSDFLALRGSTARKWSFLVCLRMFRFYFLL